jgi:hypothetical protein
MAGGKKMNHRSGWLPRFALVALAAVVVGCGSPTPPRVPKVAATPQTTTQITPTGVLVVPASNHVTGTDPGHCTARGKLPDPVCTPGSIRSDVDPNHLELTVCHPGWAASILPPNAEFARAKTASMHDYGIPAAQRSVTEYDHEIPRSLGGSNDRTNLWAQVSDEPGRGVNNSKDTVETRVHLAVCRGTVPWRDAVLAFSRDWTTAERTLGVTTKDHP